MMDKQACKTRNNFCIQLVAVNYLVCHAACFNGRHEHMVKTALDVSALQKSTVGHGFGAGSKVSFDMFRLKALMNDFRADAVRPKPETVSRQHVQRDDNSYKPEDVHKQSGITGRNTDVHT